MKKFLVQFFVSLCIFLLTGYGQLYAQLYLIYQQDSSSKHLERREQNHADGTQSISRFDKQVSVSAENPSCQFTIPLFEKAEDNDLSAFKKQLENVPFSSAILSQVPPGLISTAKNAAYPHAIISYPALSRHVVLQVFRI